MRAIIDEGVPRQIVPPLREVGCPIDPFPNRWKGTKNGRLLELLVANGYGCLLTCDKNMSYQQNLTARGLAVVILPTHDLAFLLTIVSTIAGAISDARTGAAQSVPHHRP